MTPAAKIALTALQIGAQMMTSVRQANQVINAEGLGSDSQVAAARRVLKAEMAFAEDELDQDIEAEKARRAAEQASTTDEQGT